MTVNDFRCGQSVLTGKGWFLIKSIWWSCGKVVKVTVGKSDKETTVDAERLAEAVIDIKII